MEYYAAGPVEEVIEPDLEITDAHHHFFVKGKHNWVRDYSLDDYLTDTATGHRVTKSVFLEARASFNGTNFDEVEYVTQYARESETRGGTVVSAIVGDFNLRHGSASGEALDRLLELSEGRFVGVRQAGVWDASWDIPPYPTLVEQGLYAKPDFRAGFAELVRRDLSFDAWQYHPQLPDVIALADAFPEARIITDHLGAPIKLGPYGADRDEVLRTWRRHMSELAKRENVVVKLGGIGVPDLAERIDVTGDPDVAPTSEQLAEYWGPEILWLIETFGPDRSMFESNYPVDGYMASYDVLWNTFKRIAAGASPDEKQKLFSGTANRTYRIAS
ncbi:amidohydrolase family protein [Arthrobacter sp. Z4-13]